MGGDCEVDKFFKDEIIEYEPRKVGSIENPFILSECLLKIFKGTPKRGHFPATSSSRKPLPGTPDRSCEGIAYVMSLFPGTIDSDKW